jgi:hypothetical protein
MTFWGSAGNSNTRGDSSPNHSLCYSYFTASDREPEHDCLRFSRIHARFFLDAPMKLALMRTCCRCLPGLEFPHRSEKEVNVMIKKTTKRYTSAGGVKG